MQEGPGHGDHRPDDLKALEWAGVLTWVHRIARIQVRERDLFGHWASRWRVIRTSNAYVFRDPQPRPEGVPASKSENRGGTQNQDGSGAGSGQPSGACPCPIRRSPGSKGRHRTRERRLSRSERDQGKRGGRAHRTSGQCPTVGAAARDDEEAVQPVSLHLRRAGRRGGGDIALPGLRKRRHKTGAEARRMTGVARVRRPQNGASGSQGNSQIFPTSLRMVRLRPSPAMIRSEFRTPLVSTDSGVTSCRCASGSLSSRRSALP